MKMINAEDVFRGRWMMEVCLNFDAEDVESMRDEHQLYVNDSLWSGAGQWVLLMDTGHNENISNHMMFDGGDPFAGYVLRQCDGFWMSVSRVDLINLTRDGVWRMME